MSQSNQRSTARVPVSVFVNQEFDDRHERLGMTIDLSEEGLSLVTLSGGRAPRGKHAWLRFWLPGSETLISALAEVVHEGSKGEVRRWGMRFKYLFPDQREMLRSYLSEPMIA